MVQDIEWKGLGIASGIILTGLLVGFLVVHYIIKPSLTVELIGGGALFLFLLVVISGAFLKHYGVRRKKRSRRQWAVGLVAGPLGLGVFALIGFFVHQTTAGTSVGAVILIAATLYFFIGPKR